MKNLLFIAALLACLASHSQTTYSSTFGTPFSVPITIANNRPLDGREYKYVAGNPARWRVFTSYNEAVTWQAAIKYMGLNAYIDSTGTVANNIVTGGTLLRYTYNADLQLVYDGTVGVVSGGGSGSATYSSYQNFTPTDGQTEFSLTGTPPSDPNIYEVEINGLVNKNGLRGFTISLSTLSGSNRTLTINPSVSSADYISIRWKTTTTQP